jgi:hypothetical protein
VACLRAATIVAIGGGCRRLVGAVGCWKLTAALWQPGQSGAERANVLWIPLAKAGLPPRKPRTPGLLQGTRLPASGHARLRYRRPVSGDTNGRYTRASGALFQRPAGSILIPDTRQPKERPTVISTGTTHTMKPLSGKKPPTSSPA